MIRWIWTVIAGLMLVSSGGTAQSQAGVLEKWYFAYKHATGEILAYNAGGQVNSLVQVDPNPDRNYRALRIDEQTALATLPLAGDFGVYLLTSDEARPLSTSTFDPEALDSGLAPLRLQSYHPPYAVVSQLGDVPRATGLLMNRDAGTIELLSEQPVLFQNSAYFSEDGTTLRYVHALESEKPEDWVIVERIMATGEERELYNISDELIPSLSTDRYGERWLYQQRNRENRSVISWLITADGVEQIAQENIEAAQMRRIFEDAIFSQPVDCGSGCDLSLAPIEGGDATIFPRFDKGYVAHPFFQPNADNLIVFSDRVFWLLGTDGAATKIGVWLPQNMVTPIDDMSSPANGRWLLVITGEDEANGFAVWDMAEGEYKLNQQVNDGVLLMRIIAGAGGFLVEQLSKRTWLYQESNDTITELPMEESKQGFYFDLLADGAVLYVQYQPVEDRQAGIYHYDPASGTYTLLVEDVTPIGW